LFPRVARPCDNISSNFLRKARKLLNYSRYLIIFDFGGNTINSYSAASYALRAKSRLKPFKPEETGRDCLWRQRWLKAGAGRCG
jgi:hypothetical protein